VSEISDPASNPSIILACPFCGGEAKLGVAEGTPTCRGGKPFYWVEHEAERCPIRLETGFDRDKGGMQTGYFDTAEEAIRSWNRRA